MYKNTIWTELLPAVLFHPCKLKAKGPCRWLLSEWSPRPFSVAPFVGQQVRVGVWCLTGRNVPCPKEQLGQRMTTKWYKLKCLFWKESQNILKSKTGDMLKWMHPRKFVRLTSPPAAEGPTLKKRLWHLLALQCRLFWVVTPTQIHDEQW